MFNYDLSIFLTSIAIMSTNAKYGCLIKNSIKSRENHEKFSEKYSIGEFLMRREPWGEGI